MQSQHNLSGISTKISPIQKRIYDAVIAHDLAALNNALEDSQFRQDDLESANFNSEQYVELQKHLGVFIEGRDAILEAIDFRRHENLNIPD